MYQVYEALKNAQKARATELPVTRFGAEMRVITSKLQPLFAAAGGGCVTLGVSACSPGEGASTVSRELALHLVGESMSVLLCAALGAADPSTTKSSVPTNDSSSNILATRPITMGTQDRLARADISDLYRPQSTIADKTAFADWLATASAQFDVILIDCPPVLQQQSWASILRVFNGIMLIVEAEKTRSIIIDTTLRVIEESRGKLLGFIFNKRRQYVPSFLYRWL